MRLPKLPVALAASGGRPNSRFWLSVILGLFAVLATTYSVVTPLFEGPDEVWHYAFADYLAQGRGLPVLQASSQDIRLRNAAHTPLYHFLIAAVIAPFDRRDFPSAYRFNLASPNITPGSVSDRPNLIIHTPHEDFPYRQTVLAVHLARLVSVALGVLTVAGVWQVARLIFPGEKGLALLAAALAAFVPQFVYGFGLINNDALAAAATVWLLAAVIQLMTVVEEGRGGCAGAAIETGLLLGVSLLSKVGMVAIAPLPVLALGVSLARKKNWPRVRAYLWAGLLIYGAAAAVAGWWYVRNFLLYGDPLAWRQWQALAGVGRTPPTLADFVPEMLGLFGTFWADFTMRLDRQIGGLFAVISLVAVAGLVRRARRRDWPAGNLSGAAAAGLAFGLMLALVLGYSLTIYDIPGRLMFPALATIGLALALGFTAWRGRFGRWLGGGVVAVLLLVDGMAPAVILGPAYARPVLASASLPADTTPTSIRFGASIELVGYRLENPSVTLGQSARVFLYWKTQAPAPRQIPNIFGEVTLALPNGQIIGDTTVRLGTTVYPSSEWRPGQVIVTNVSVTAKPVEPPVVAAVTIGVTNEGESALLPTSQGNRIQLGRLAVRAKVPAPCAIGKPVGQTFGNAIRLVGYRLEPGKIVFCWQALQPSLSDYTVFIHSLDAQGQLLPGGDAPPRSGNYPTSVWAVGETVEDAHDLPAGDQGVLTIGLYRPDTGERLMLDGTVETELKITP